MSKRVLLPQAPACETELLPIDPTKPWLAPLAGYSDLPFRLLCREYGAAVCETEMVSAKGLLYASPATNSLLASTKEDQALVVQLFGSDREALRQASHLLREAGYRNLDFNMGCPVKKVLKQRSGAYLLSDPPLALELAKVMIQEAKCESAQKAMRIGFKLRLGLRPGQTHIMDLALKLEDAGADWLTLHPRYASQGYAGQAEWDALALLAERLSIPLIASGDLLDAESGLRCLKYSGARGLMYARGAMRNPAIFKDHATLCAGKPLNVPCKERIIAILLRHIHYAENFGEGRRAFAKLRSIVPRYARVFRGSQELRQKLAQCTDWSALKTLIAEACQVEL